MQNVATEKLLSRVLGFGASLTTIFLISGSVTDPVNTPKLLILGIMASSALGLTLSTNLRSRISGHRHVLAPLVIFLAWLLFATLKSNSPISQNIYGSYGRNNGLFTYFFLALTLICTLALREFSNFNLLVRSLFFAGLVNVAYCLWAILFGDFIGWSNPYGNILGTLGNPDFIGAFLGLFFSAYLAYGIGKQASRAFKLSMFLVLPVTAYEIVDSHAIQGRAVAVLGVGIVGFFYLRSRFKPLIVNIYSLFAVGAGVLAVAGALQFGPLTKYIYKTSVSLRGQYWLAAWNTGKSHLFAGVGMDTFGDWYRRSRAPHAIELPGVNTVVNAAHNVWMDMFASGGLILLIAYLILLIITAISITKVIVRKKEYDPIFVSLTVAWVGYQAQSIISINQIGLAIWGWMLSGALIAYETTTRVATINVLHSSGKRSAKSKPNDQNAIGILAASISGLVGLLVALPPLTADTKWRSAQLTNSAQAIESTMQPNYFNPLNSTKFLTNIQALEANNLFDLSHKYALEAVKWNPESFELWKVLYLVKNSTASEKATALSQMKRLDPLNPDVTSIK